MQVLSAVEINVGVKIGSLVLNAQELIDLNRGQVFEFAFDPSETFALSIGDEEIAKVRFVQCAENLALEIVAISGEQEVENDRVIE